MQLDVDLNLLAGSVIYLSIRVMCSRDLVLFGIDLTEAKGGKKW